MLTHYNILKTMAELPKYSSYLSGNHNQSLSSGLIDMPLKEFKSIYAKDTDSVDPRDKVITKLRKLLELEREAQERLMKEAGEKIDHKELELRNQVRSQAKLAKDFAKTVEQRDELLKQVRNQASVAEVLAKAVQQREELQKQALTQAKVRDNLAEAVPQRDELQKQVRAQAKVAEDLVKAIQQRDELQKQVRTQAKVAEDLVKAIQQRDELQKQVRTQAKQNAICDFGEQQRQGRCKCLNQYDI
uniref:Uncharacterized protein n=1 Tax=Ditylenchus dipsaci TaxID=166011 RepID=A0A915E2L7_9BILA